MQPSSQADPVPLFSIIIPTHARRETLRRILTKLRDLPGPPREIIVIDDASQDGTQDMLRDYSEVRVLRNEVARGFDALPEALRMARGELVFQLDDDAWPADATLDLVAEHFCARGPQLGAVALPFSLPGSGRLSYTPYHPTPEAGCSYGPARAFHAGAVVFRREAALQVPPSPPGYFMFETEIPTTIELLSCGWEVDYFPAAPVYHLWEAHARGVRAHAAFLALRNDLVTIRRYYRGLRKAEMLAGRHLTGFLHLGVAGRPGWALRAAREARAMLAQSPRRRVPDEVLQRIYPAFDGLTLLTLFSETNRRRVSWLLGRAGVDQVC